MKISAGALLLLCLPSCQSINDLKQGNTNVPLRVLEGAAEDPDPALDAPLNEILATRIAGYTKLHRDVVVIAAINAQVRRQSTSVIPYLEELAFDPSTDVRIYAMNGLAEIGAVDSLPTLYRAAVVDGQLQSREEAYQAFSELAGEHVYYLDQAGMQRILIERGFDLPRIGPEIGPLKEE